MCALKKLQEKRVAWECGSAVAMTSVINVPTPAPRNLRGVGGSLWQGKVLWRPAHAAMARDTCSSTVLEREKPEFNSVMILREGLIWSWLFCFRKGCPRTER